MNVQTEKERMKVLSSLLACISVTPSLPPPPHTQGVVCVRYKYFTVRICAVSGRSAGSFSTRETLLTATQGAGGGGGGVCSRFPSCVYRRGNKLINYPLAYF